LLRSLTVALHGRDVNALLTLGFKLETMADLIGGGLARVRVEVVNDSGLKIAVAYVRITVAGRRALEGLISRRRSSRPPVNQ
jgi:hydrogenase maturation factor